MVSRYKAQADIKQGVHALKSDLENTPVHHRRPERIRADAMICFPALALYRVMRLRLKARQHIVSPRTTLDCSRAFSNTAEFGDRTFNGTE